MFNNQTLMDFDVTCFPLDNLDRLDWSRGAAKFPKFFKGEFSVSSKADCFVRFDGFTKGYIWVNGFNLGRFWNAGPQRALYLPGALLRTDAPNELVILELEGSTASSVTVTDRPDLG